MTTFRISYEQPPVVSPLAVFIDAPDKDTARKHFLTLAPSSKNRSIRPATAEEKANLKP